LHKIFSDYLVHLELAGVDSQTVRLNRRSLSYADRYLASIGKDAASAQPEDYEVFFHRLLKDGAGVATRPLAASTVAGKLSNIRAAYHYAIKVRRIDFDPTITVRRPTPDHHDPETLTNAELRRIWNACTKPNEVTMFGLLVYTGMRQAEILKLQWEQVDFDADMIRIHGRGHRGGGSIGKGGKARNVPVHPDLREILIAHLVHRQGPYVLRSQKGSCYSGQGLRQVPEALLDRAGVHRTGFHTFRRTFNSSLLENDALERYVEQIMGHSPKTINRRFYQRQADQKLATTIRLVYMDDPILKPPRRALSAV